MRKNRALGAAGVAVILLVLISFIARTPAPPSGTTTTSSASNSTLSACPQPLPGPSTASYVRQIQGAVGSTVELDSGPLFSLDSAALNYQWSQVFANATELDYVSNFPAALTGADSENASATFNEPGNYRFMLQASALNGSVSTRLIDVNVTEFGVRHLQAKGVIFGDVFDDLGGPDFTMGPYPEACQAERFSNALAAPLSVGAGWVGYVPAEFYTQVAPEPKFAGDGNDLSLTNDTYYYAMMAAAHSEGFKVVEFVQASTGPNTPANQSALLPSEYNSSSWWASWFDAWKQVVVAEAERAQKAGVEMLVICLYCEDTFRPQVYANYSQGWDDIIASVRQVYSGKVAMSLIVADSRFTMYDKLDAVFITAFPGLYISAGAFADPQNPTMQELVKQTNVIFGYASWLAGKIPVYYILTVESSNGQYDPDPPPWAPNPPPANLTDFREQAMYYEAFLSALKNQTWVTGFFSERWDYFDHFARTGETPASYYFDQTIGPSPRNKPAEAVLRLWFSVY